MNNVLEYIYNHPKETKRIIGITDKQLIKLIENAQKVEDKKRQAIASGEKRLIKAGGGRKKSLGKAEEIILTLYYLHHVPTFQILGVIFGQDLRNSSIYSGNILKMIIFCTIYSVPA